QVNGRNGLKTEDLVVIEADALQRAERVVGVAAQDGEKEKGNVFKLKQDAPAIEKTLMLDNGLAGLPIDDRLAEDALLDNVAFGDGRFRRVDLQARIGGQLAREDLCLEA